MISVMNDFEIDRNPNSDPDLSFFGMESPTKEEDDGSDPMEADEAPTPLDLTIEPVEIEEEEPRVSSPVPLFPLMPHESPPMAEEANGLVTGGMVWGKVKSHPWWPGHIFNESFALPSVRRMKRDNFVLVAFFGDSSYGWFDLSELIPYGSNFVEKTKQTTSRSFIRAVEESVDEASRRAALGISCRCHNPYNFRLTRVPDYFEVDVVGYERNGIYSKSQINRERRSFEPSDALGFLKQLAVTPKQKKTQDVEWYRNVALVLALRRHMYEEFDPTYAQAFGQQPVGPVRDEKGVPEQAESFAPRVAPLSGPLVFAEALSVKKKHSASTPTSSSYYSHRDRSPSSHKDKDKDESYSSSKKKKKKNKYVLKRRDDRPAAAAASSSPPLPHPYFVQKKQPTAPSFVLADPPASSSALDYVLQKRELAEGVRFDAELPQTPPLPVPDNNVFHEKLAAADGAVFRKKEKKLKKRSLDDVNSQEEAKLKKKKRREGFGQDFPPLLKKLAVKPSSEDEAAAESSVAPPPPPCPVEPLLPDVDLRPLDQTEMYAVLADLRALALDPFYGVEREVPLKVLHLLLRFRTQFYSKSLPTEGDAEAQRQEGLPSKLPAVAVAVAAAAARVVPPSSKKEPKERLQQSQREHASSSSKPAKLMKRTDDSTESGRKRAPSDRQEEMWAKRNKKVCQVKSLASAKRAALTKKTSTDGPKGNNGATAAAMAAGPSTVEPARRLEKQELGPLLPPPPPSGNPAFLIMKFPPKSTLPSVSNLKARFARFGSLDVDSIRVSWRSHSCKVQFRHNSDAVRAMHHVESNVIFGPKVDYNIKEVGAPAPEPQNEPPRQRLELQGDGSLQFRLGNGAGSSSGIQLRGGQQQQPQLQLQLQPQGRLKSILKKPGDDAAKENQRVKFVLSGNGNGGSSSKRSSPPPSSSSVGSSDMSPPRPPPSKSATFQLSPPEPPQPRQNLQQPPLLPPARSYEPHRPSLPPPPTRSYEPRQQLQMPLPLPPPFRSIENRAPVTSVQFTELPPLPQRPPVPSVQFTELPPPPQRPPVQLQQQYGGERDGGRIRNNNVDISQRMLSLLIRCKDIVSSLRSLPDFSPYRPL